MQITHKKHKYFRVADKYKGKSISGTKLTRAARKREKEKDGSGHKLLKLYVPALSDKRIRAILKGSHCLVGMEVLFFAIDSDSFKKLSTQEKQKTIKNRFVEDEK